MRSLYHRIQYGIYALIIFFGTMLTPLKAYAEKKPIDINELLPALGGQGAEGAEALPQVGLPILVSQIIKIVIGITAPITLVAFIVAGVLFVTARGDEEQLGKAKNTIWYAFIGLIVIAVSYAVILGLSRLTFEDYG